MLEAGIKSLVPKCSHVVKMPREFLKLKLFQKPLLFCLFRNLRMERHLIFCTTSLTEITVIASCTVFASREYSLSGEHSMIDVNFIIREKQRRTK